MKITLERAKYSADAAGGSRIGTAVCPLSILCERLGEPTYRHDRGYRHYNGPRIEDDVKVTIGWVFHSPRGRVELRDYWWNREGEWSLAAHSVKGSLWLAAYLRSLGIAASAKAYKYDDVRPFTKATL